MLPVWRSLAAAAAAAVGLVQRLSEEAAALQRERVDLALAAADRRQRLADAAGSCWSAAGPPQADQAAEALVLAFAALTERQAAAVLQLASAAADEDDEGEELGSDDGEPASLDALQQLVLGYASTAVAVRDATSEALFAAPDGGASVLAWLSTAVQAADSVSTAAAELQLLLPALLALLHVPAAAAQVAEAVAEAEGELEEALSEEETDQSVTESEEESEQGDVGGGDSEQRYAVTAGGDGGILDRIGGRTAARGEEEVAAAAMQPLLAAAALHPALAGLLQVQAASQQLLAPEEQTSPAAQQLQLAAAVVGAWRELEGAVEDSGAWGGPEAGPAPVTAVPWRQCSAVLAAAVTAEVQEHLLPPLAAALLRTAQQLRAAAPRLARRGGGGPAPQPALLPPGWGATAESTVQHHQETGGQPALPSLPDLVPFTAFGGGGGDGSSTDGGGGDDMLLGELEPVGAQGDGAMAGRGGGAELVPWMDFNTGLPGACEVCAGAVRAVVWG